MTLEEARAAFPDIAARLYDAPDDVQDGWDHLGGSSFAPHTPSAEEDRQAAIEAAISSDTTLHQIKAMTSAEYDAWWSSNVTNNAQANAMLKRVVRVLVRKVL